MRQHTSRAIAMLIAFGLAIGGCANKLSDPSQPSAKEGESRSPSQSKKVDEALAGLSDSDLISAKKQATCPVSGEPLGSMGKPIKVQAGKRDVWICCKGCEEALKQEPEKYLAKFEEEPDN